MTFQIPIVIFLTTFRQFAVIFPTSLPDLYQRYSKKPFQGMEIINSDQGCQFTGKEWADACSQHYEMKVSTDGRGRAKDNIWIERF